MPVGAGHAAMTAAVETLIDVAAGAVDIHAGRAGRATDGAPHMARVVGGADAFAGSGWVAAVIHQGDDRIPVGVSKLGRHDSGGPCHRCGRPRVRLDGRQRTGGWRRCRTRRGPAKGPPASEVPAPRGPRRVPIAPPRPDSQGQFRPCLGARLFQAPRGCGCRSTSGLNRARWWLRLFASGDRPDARG